MTPENWKAALRPSADCPETSRLAEFAARSLELAERNRIQAHLHSCARCATELSLLAAYEEELPRNRSDLNWIVARLKRRAREVTGQHVPRRPFLSPVRAGALLVAASVVLAAGAALLYRSRLEAPSLGLRQDSTAVLRSDAVETIAPAGDLDRPPAELSWRAVPAASHYQVVVQEVDRTPLWSTSSQQTCVPLPAPVQAQCVPGKTLMWQVRALNPAGEAIAASELQRFRVALRAAQ